MKLGLVGGLTAVAFAAVGGGGASAGTYSSPPHPSSLADCVGCAVTVITNSANYTPPALPSGLAALNLGTTATAGLVTTNEVTSGSHPVALPAGTDITSITFSAGTEGPSGVYAGNTNSVALSPFGGGSNITQDTPTNNYLVAQGGGGSVVINYNTGQTTLDLLWGTVDTTPSTYNELTFETSTGQMVTGADIATIVGGSFPTATQDVIVEISGLTTFTNVTANDTAAPAFEFDVIVPAPAIGQGLPVALAFGGMLFGVWGWNRSKKRGTLGAATA